MNDGFGVGRAGVSRPTGPKRVVKAPKTGNQRQPAAIKALPTGHWTHPPCPVAACRCGVADSHHPVLQQECSYSVSSGAATVPIAVPSRLSSDSSHLPNSERFVEFELAARTQLDKTMKYLVLAL